MVGFADQCCDGSADLDADRIAFGGEDAWIGRAIWRDLARLVLVTVQTVNTDCVERLEIPFPHPCERQPVQPRIVRDEADNALAGRLRDPALRNSEDCLLYTSPSPRDS